ncbi:hypothetical protein AV530_020082 [Patagioenas fasciata monilis]|uniref:Uncharacterized protein n=1 Tax=Patagioenas fasciata monilis TaxID=372326 RepID=A0A1V4JHZ1_PATFA|nr:hypothetical protein AV530_020082 [Patagioenas fasciata monilis]
MVLHREMNHNSKCNLRINEHCSENNSSGQILPIQEPLSVCSLRFIESGGRRYPGPFGPHQRDRPGGKAGTDLLTLHLILSCRCFSCCCLLPLPLLILLLIHINCKIIRD